MRTAGRDLLAAGFRLGHLRAQVDDDRLRPGRCHAARDVLDVGLVGLTEVSGEADDVAAGLDPPSRNRLAVEPTRDANAELLTLEISQFHDALETSGAGVRRP